MDIGTEYKSQQFQALMKKYDIHYYFFTTGSTRQSERVHRTLRSKLIKYMIRKNTNTYIDVLQNIVTSYNRTKHSTIGIRPYEVARSN